MKPVCRINDGFDSRLHNSAARQFHQQVVGDSVFAHCCGILPHHEVRSAVACNCHATPLWTRIFTGPQADRLCLAKILSGANAFEISDIQEAETEGALTWRSGCN